MSNKKKISKNKSKIFTESSSDSERNESDCNENVDGFPKSGVSKDEKIMKPYSWGKNC